MGYSVTNGFNFNLLDNKHSNNMQCTQFYWPSGRTFEIYSGIIICGYFFFYFFFNSVLDFFLFLPPSYQIRLLDAFTLYIFNKFICYLCEKLYLPILHLKLPYIIIIVSGMLIVGVMLRNIPGIKIVGDSIDPKWSGALR